MSLNIDELNEEFEISGFLESEDSKLEEFNPSNNYTAFIVNKRTTFEI
jgi:hypothetical protein